MISFVWNSSVDEILGNGKVSGVRLRNVDTGETSEIEAGGVFVAIGHDPPAACFPPRRAPTSSPCRTAHRRSRALG